MSKAGIQSNRGDGYQTLVAFDWALQVLADPVYEWLEVDSATSPVDDVVVGRTDGTTIHCQCKKNSPTHIAWSVGNLKDELLKAAQLLSSNNSAVVRYYSRSAFGELEALKEFSANYPDPDIYQANLGASTQATDEALGKLLFAASPNLSTYDFLQRTWFEPTPSLERMQELLQARLRNIASNSANAYQALWTRLDHLGMRVNTNGSSSAAIQHRLSKADIKSTLIEAGAMLTPPMDLRAIRTEFQSTSAIGRNWRRDIGGEQIPNPLVDEIMSAIDRNSRAFLVTGTPGAGKTCIMLALQEALERRSQTTSDIQPFFIQSREFADLNSAQERQAMGLKEHWVEWVARMADMIHTVVVIDSLDVLSIAREHKILDYFLAQMDRLLCLPNVTVITACRDFDHRYDRRIAQRKWDREFKCAPLNWVSEVTPLLNKLGIDTSTVDATMRELISNPRELALFVELAQQDGSFNVVTSQALAQRYLQTIVLANPALGDAAMRAIESVATEMLSQRSLAIPSQRFTASHDIQRTLLSHQILQWTQDKKLTFGHQTLLDVLVISGAIRQGITLDTFIRNLQPVPFVRPSIRSFVAQLAAGDRRAFRGQLRTVLTGTHAFHIRRLVAECLAGQIPQDDDWPLIRDLKTQQPEVFQVIYYQAVQVEWHPFWRKHLIPTLIANRDSEGLTRHAQRIAQWKNADAQDVINFWIEAFSHDWVDRKQLGRQVTYSLHNFDMAHAALLAPVLGILLQMPREEHSFLGHALARCVAAGGLEDATLWRYIVADIGDEEVRSYNLGDKLHCQPHEFNSSDENFLSQRMQQSPALLALAISTIEQWRHVRKERWHTFLRDSSYNDTHSQTDMHHVDAARVLLNAIEAGIGVHAQAHTTWWQKNRERLCFNEETALRYFAILACTSSPAQNLDVIGRMLCDRDNLESDLTYELGTLIHHAFILLDEPTQAAVQKAISAIDQEHAADPARRVWMLQAQAQLILSIPCNLRQPAAQAIVVECENHTWPLLRQPSIGIRGGIVVAPFSFEVFLSTSNDGVLRLLAHYSGYDRDSWDDFGMGGDSQVGGQLREAASRSPSRFMALLDTHWDAVPGRFRNDILDGARTYLAYTYGNLQANNWAPVDEPEAMTLTRQVLDELERHPDHWHHSRDAAKALEGAAHVVKDMPTAARLVALAYAFLSLHEESSVSGDRVNLLTHGINMAKGNVADALMILATKLQQEDVPWPDSLAPALMGISGDAHPAVRAVVLRRLHYLQHLAPDIGWKVFRQAMQESTDGLWQMAEPCLYYAYHQQFTIVQPWLDQLYMEGKDKDLETWGRISALAALSDKIRFSSLLASLKSLNAESAWRGAASVWTHPSNVQQHQEQCFGGLEAGLDTENPFASSVARKISRFFHETTSLVHIPLPIMQRCFGLLADSADKSQVDLHGIDAWLNATALHAPAHALEVAEMYLTLKRHTQSYLYDHGDNFTQLLTRLFAQAEEQEESDRGAMLQRVVAVQDTLMTLGMHGIDDWLKAIERP
ncbi:AAA family ATPase [Rhodoferax bucti]|uniref:AAA family ATPase n=1 Tax=Rhodoferax bucti TaxID=2576305 RepID=UPI001109C8C8|nr:AAA family ATPase [Rhodoferax bucti]